MKQRVQHIIDKMTRRIGILREGGDETAIARAHLSKAVVELRESIDATDGEQDGKTNNS